MPRPKGLPKTGGKQKGYKAPHTLEKEAMRQRVRELVAQRMDPMIQAQIAHAIGVSYMVLRRPDGTFTRATDEKEVNAAIAAGAEFFNIYTQSPNTQAFTDLMNRAIDKPAEQKQQHEHTGAITLIHELGE